jgi:hypothetical protein
MAFTARRVLLAGLIGLIAAATAVGVGAGPARATLPDATVSHRTDATVSHRTVSLTPASFDPQCTDPSFPAVRTAANPLLLSPAPTGADVLKGASFFVPGPARGDAAGAIAQLLGYAPGQALDSGPALAGFADTESWQTFKNTTVAQDLPSQSPSVQQQIGLLETIADEPHPVRISNSGGGAPATVYTQMRKLFCTVLQSDPDTIPIVTTDFLHPELGQCPTVAQITNDTPLFKSQVNAVAAAIARRPVALFLEIDAVGSSSCMANTTHSIGAWEKLVKYEAQTLEALPHTAVYLEGGYSDANNPAYAARLLNAMGIRQVQGFYTNGTHLQWTDNELSYAKQVSKLTGGAHFVINTSGNGRGPLLNPHPRTEGIEDLCNPPGRGLGIPDTTTLGLSSDLDALLWVTPPGNSSGSCNGGPASGTFWVARAEMLAANANLQLGPHTKSLPY